MFPDKPQISITIPSKTDLLKMVVELTQHIATIEQFLPTDSQKIALAVDEAITNVIKHSYNYQKNREIRLEFYSDNEGLKIRIIFSGVPPEFSNLEVDLKRYIREGKKGGLGVELIKRIMDSVEYGTEDNLNTCEMVKWKRKR